MVAAGLRSRKSLDKLHEAGSGADIAEVMLPVPVGGLQHGPEPVADETEKLVARRKTVSVVDRFEPVEIDQQQRVIKPDFFPGEEPSRTLDRSHIGYFGR